MTEFFSPNKGLILSYDVEYLKSILPDQVMQITFLDIDFVGLFIEFNQLMFPFTP